jgi:hypothetical protein
MSEPILLAFIGAAASIVIALIQMLSALLNRQKEPPAAD